MLLWMGVIAGVVIGGFILIGGMSMATTAPQEAVVISLALACAILPYCFARAFTEMTNLDK
ncbi:MAG: hypothetical protein JWN60_2290 [Acidobacteria bacterium]|nr:hypothetical protein [Acidobacteriota bacterium]